MIIAANSLEKSFSKHKVLNNIQLQINEHERVALIGFNGAGKTTLIRCILGEYLFDGDLKIFGLHPRIERNEILNRIGFVPQLPPPLKMSVRDLFDFSAEVSNSKVEQMKEVSRYLGLDLDRALSLPFNKLSGGQKQKVLISIALGRKTNLLILDEPAANLDPEARGLFYNLLEQKKTEASMLISSHRIDEVASLVTRVVELDKGQIVLDDKVSGGDQLGRLFNVKLHIQGDHEIVARTMRDWSLNQIENGTYWQGIVSGPDRLRFLGVLSRYSGFISHVEIIEKVEI